MLGLGLGLGIPTMVGTTDGPFNPLDLSPVLWLDASDTSTITAADGAWLDGTGLVLPGLSGNYASTPDSAALSVTGDIDIKVKLTLPDWTPGSIAFVATKSTSVADQRAYYLTIHTTGTIRFYWSPDGVSVLNAQSTVATGVADGGTKWVRATLDVDNGSSQYVAKFYTSDDGSSWAQLGSTVTAAGTTSIYDASSVLEFGSYNSGALGHTPMTVHRAIIQDAFDTADNTTNVVFDADFAAEAAGTLSFTEDSTNAATVTLTTTYGLTSQWDDKSGNGYNVTQGTAANQPKSGTRTLNGRNVIDFDGSTDRMSLSTYISTNGLTVFAVGIPDVVTGGPNNYDGRNFIGSYLASFIQDFSLGVRASQVTVYAETGTSNVHAVVGSLSAGVPILAYGQSNASQTVARLNGTAGTTQAGTRNDLKISAIGKDAYGSYYWDGTIAEIIVIDGTLTAGEIAATELHLGTKWGIYNVPDAITDLATSTIEATSIGLTWTAPADNGQTITQYVVEVSADGSIWSTFGSTTSTSVTVTGLTTDVEYSFRVRAVNAVGSGGLSNVVTGTPFDVLALSPVLWLDAADTATITESGGAVSQWDNKGSLGNFTQGTAANQPTTGASTLNGLNVIDFAADYLVSADAASAYNDLHNGTDYIVAAVIKFGTTADPNTVYDWLATVNSSTQSGMILRYDDRTASGYNDRLQHLVYRSVSGIAAVSNFSSSDAAGANAFGVATFLADPDNATASARSAMFWNSGAAISNNTVTNAVSTADAQSALHVGSLPGVFNVLTGSIAELVIITGANATEANRQAIHNYLNSKWGIY